MMLDVACIFLGRWELLLLLFRLEMREFPCHCELESLRRIRRMVDLGCPSFIFRGIWRVILWIKSSRSNTLRNWWRSWSITIWLDGDLLERAFDDSHIEKVFRKFWWASQTTFEESALWKPFHNYLLNQYNIWHINKIWFLFQCVAKIENWNLRF